MILAAIIFKLGILVPAWADLIIDVKGLPSSQIVEGQRKLDAVWMALPPIMREALSSDIKIEFKNWPAPQERRTTIFGEYRDRKIYLNKSLQAALTSPSDHLKVKRVLAHELMHAYEHALKASKKQKLSQNEQFLALLNFTKRGVIVRTRSQSNVMEQRSPDVYEFENPKEAVAVNFEHFLLDPEFGCRRPAVYHFLSRALNFEPTKQCETSHLVAVNNGSFISERPFYWANIDPKRVYSIHYLFASKGSALMSRWGHAMFRIVLCAPERTQVGPECELDIDHHVVASYRANINELKISYWKGLIGAYPSQLFLLDFAQVIEEYTKGELRDLLSVPMSLSEEEKNLFLFRVIEHAWSYRSKYKFLSNNCATESLNLIKGTVDDAEFNDKYPFSPKGLYSDLEKTKLMEADLLADKTAAQARGLLIVSKRASLQRAFEILKQKGLRSDKADVKEFVEKSKPVDRRRDYENLLTLNPGERMKLAALCFALESQAEHMAQKQYMKFLGKKLFDLKNTSPLYSKSLDLRKSYDQLMAWNLVPQGYGAPTLQEILGIDEASLTERSRSLNRETKALFEQLKQLVPEKTAEITYIEESVKWLRQLALSMQPSLP
ncbi:MAG: DUF4105 domain-containing protein [Oligoflexia bacterium]|nr:DUF4105 domain-containing protein [Oligoflexia bacterium]